MRITTARRIAQAFFFLLFAWLCLVAAVGTGWFQWRGWPIRWFLELDPLVAVGTVLTTHSLYPGLAWALGTIVVTILLGRVFCGWICPFGTIHQAAGWIGRHGRRPKLVIDSNQYHPLQRLKYGILAAFLVAAAVPPKLTGLAHLHTGLLDPIPLVQRSFNLVVLPVAGLGSGGGFSGGRFYAESVVIGTVFLGFVLLNFAVPRLFCRFVCPLGALLAILGRAAPFGIKTRKHACTECGACNLNCEGACNPKGPIQVSECLLCMNCFEDCPTSHPIGYGPRPSLAGEITSPGLSRRGFVASVVAGLAVVPLSRLSGSDANNWQAGLVRPPGAVAEDEFLARCIKCGECMRVCPTNVLQPAGFSTGMEVLWTPVLNNRIGTSGCQMDCVACGYACPTGAIRRLTLDEKLGRGESRGAGPIRLGLAAVDRGRCRPWAMGRPCIVCEETCPVSPKAITVEEAQGLSPDGVAVRLQRPVVDPSRCIGCGVCEHECPMNGIRAIRVSADNESRDPAHSILLHHENKS